MIRHIRLTDQVNEDADDFAFFDTVTNRFLDLDGQQVFTDRDDLEAAITAAVTEEGVRARLVGLLPVAPSSLPTERVHGTWDHVWLPADVLSLRWMPSGARVPVFDGNTAALVQRIRNDSAPLRHVDILVERRNLTPALLAWVEAQERGQPTEAPVVGVVLDYGSGVRVPMEPIQFVVAGEGIVRVTMREVTSAG